MTTIENVILVIASACSGYLFSQLRVRKNMREYPIRTFASYSRVYNSLNQIVQKTDVDRVILLKESDYGDEGFGSVLFEQHSSNIPGAMYSFQKNRLDEHYRNDIIKELHRSQILFLVTDELPHHSFLWRKYKADGVKSSLVCLIHKVSHRGLWFKIKQSITMIFGGKSELSKTYYLSCNATVDGLSIFLPDQRMVIESEANAIAQEFIMNGDLEIL